MDAGHLEEFTLMIYRMDFIRVAENMTFTIAQDRAIFPASLQQLIDNLQIFIGIVVARIMVGLSLMSDITRTAFQIGGYNIPANAAFG